MKKHFLISLLVMAAAAVLAVISGASMGMGGFVLDFGLMCCIGGVICLAIAGIIRLLRNSQTKERDNNLSSAFLMAAGITFLIGTGVCSTLLMGMK